MSTQEIVDIYTRVEIQRGQTAKKVRAEIQNTLGGKLTSVFTKYFELLKDPKTPIAVQDEAKREMTKTLNIIVMDSDHDVIMALTNNMLIEKAKEKRKIVS